MTKKVNNTSTFLQRNINRCPEAIKTLCYQTSVRPIVGYVSTVWDPFTEKCDHHDRNLELQAGGSQARNVVRYRRQPCGRINIRTHSRSREITYRYLQPSTHTEAYKHSFFQSTIKSWGKCTHHSFIKQLHSIPT